MLDETPDYLALLGHKSPTEVPEAEELRAARASATSPRRQAMAENRVRIKQYLRRHGTENIKRLAAALNLTYHTAYKYCRLLAMDGEVRVTKSRGLVTISLPADIVGADGVQCPAG